MTMVTWSVEEGSVELTITRPEAANALNRQMGEELGEVLAAAADIPRPLVLRSGVEGRFVSGADIGELRDRSRADGLRRATTELFQRLEDHPWPTVAVVDGPALGGGCELALACDLRVATPESTWGQPEVRLGLVPGAGGLWRLPRAVGWTAAVDLILTGRRIEGTEAAQLGLVSRLVTRDKLAATVDEVLAQLAAGAAPALRLAKEAMRVPPDHRRAVDALAMALCYESDEAQERMTSFLEQHR